MKTPPAYTTPSGWKCPNCGEESKIIPDLNDYDDEFGTVYLPGWGQPVCDCCEHPVEADEIEMDYDYPEYKSDY